MAIPMLLGGVTKGLLGGAAKKAIGSGKKTDEAKKFVSGKDASAIVKQSKEGIVKKLTVYYLGEKCMLIMLLCFFIASNLLSAPPPKKKSALRATVTFFIVYIVGYSLSVDLFSKSIFL